MQVGIGYKSEPFRRTDVSGLNKHTCTLTLSSFSWWQSDPSTAFLKHLSYGIQKICVGRSVVFRLVQMVLAKEPVLDGVLKLQQMDRFDVEGIYPLYSHACFHMATSSGASVFLLACVLQHRECNRTAPRRGWKTISRKGKFISLIDFGCRTDQRTTPSRGCLY